MKAGDALLVMCAFFFTIGIAIVGLSLFGIGPETNNAVYDMGMIVVIPAVMLALYILAGGRDFS